MTKFRLIRQMCKLCHDIFDPNIENHKCSPSPSVSTIINAAESPSSCKSLLMSKLVTQNENQEQTDSLNVSELHVIYETHMESRTNDDVALNIKSIDFQCKQRPLSNDCVPLSTQDKSDKQSMCNESLKKMNDAVPVNNNWKCLTGESLQKKPEAASSAESENEQENMSSIIINQLLEDVQERIKQGTLSVKRPRDYFKEYILNSTTNYTDKSSEETEQGSTPVKKPRKDSHEHIVNNSTNSTDQSSERIPQKTEQGSKLVESSKNDLDEFPFLVKMNKLKPNFLLNKLLDDKDASFCKYVSSLMKKLPLETKLGLQSEFIADILINLLPGKK